MRSKLKQNNDHFVDEEAKIEYIFTRLDEDVINHINARRVVDSDYYKTIDQVFKILKGIYEDRNKRGKSRVEYRILKQERDVL